MGAGGGPAGVPHDHEGVGEAHRVARRHAEARLEAAARFERGNRDGRHLRPDEGRARPSGMTRRRLVMGVAFAAGCASRSGGPVAASAPVTPAATAPSDRKSTRLNSSHTVISYAVFCLKKKKKL